MVMTNRQYAAIVEDAVKKAVAAMDKTGQADDTAKRQAEALESGRVWDVAITHDEREKLDSLMWLKRCRAMLFKGDGVTVWFNGAQAPLSVVDCYKYEER